MFGYIILAIMVVVIFFIAQYVAKRVKNRDYYSLKNEVSRRLYKQHQALPAIHQYPNFINILRALEVKHPDSDGHFYYTDYGYSDTTRIFSFDRGYDCSHGHCQYGYREYHELHSKMNDIKKSVDAQERAMALMGVRNGLDSYDDFIRHAKAEAELVSEVTKDMS